MENIERLVEQGVILIKLTTTHLMSVALNANCHSKIKPASIHCLVWKKKGTVPLSVKLHSSDGVNVK